MKDDFVVLKDVQIQDAKALLDIYGWYVKETAITFEYDVPSVEEFENRIRNISEKYPYIKAVSGSGEILGYAYASTFKGRRAYDWDIETSIYIKREMQHCGLGKLLYDGMEKLLKNMGITNMNACITVPKENDSRLTDNSFKFHEHLGFSMVGVFHDCGYKFNTWYNMCWMEKMIGEHKKQMKEVDFSKRKIGS